MEKANLDLMNNGQAQGDLASKILANGKLDLGLWRPTVSVADGKTYVTVHMGGSKDDVKNYKKIQVNTTGTLRRDEWKALDEAVQGIAESRLVGINDLVSRGLVYNLSNPMGTTVLETTTSSDALEAELSMTGETRAKGDRQTFTNTYLPIPIIHADYDIGMRALAASRNMGNGLDTGMAERAARKVAQFLEQMLYTKTSYKFGGGTIYSYLNYPSRGLANLGIAWDDTSVTGKQIVEQVSGYKQTSINNKHYGPWILYIPTAYEVKMDTDYSSTEPSAGTIRERLLKIAGVQDVKVIDELTADNVLFVQMTSNVIRLVQGTGLQNVEWASEGGMVKHYKVMTIAVPQIRSNDELRTGIVHAS